MTRKKRRQFLLEAGALLVVPFSLGAQPPKAKPVVGFLVPANPKQVFAMFTESMGQLGYVEGRNLVMELRSADGKAERLPELAAELVRLKVDVLVAVQTPAVTAARNATRDVPIVMAGVGDPVGTGLIASLARPGGNLTGITGITAEISGKALELIRELKPASKRIGVLANANDPFTKPYLEHLRLAGQRLALEISSAMVRQTSEFEAALAEMARNRSDVVIVQPSLQRRAAAEMALKHRLAAFSPTSQFTGEGGLMSYSASQSEVQKVAAAYVDRILKGAKPPDLPVQQSSIFDLAVNLKTARALGVTIPKSILARADRVIE